MRLQYKKVGDTLTYPEYNAICYLLTHGTWHEKFNLSLTESVEGNFASYIIDDRNKVLSETRDGYVIVKNINSLNKDDRLIYLTINHEDLHSHLEVIFHAVHVTHINQQDSDDGTEMSVTIQKEDFLDPVEDELPIYHESDVQPLEEDITISVVTDIDDKEEVVIFFDPVAFGLNKGDWIQNVAELNLSYTEPEINYTDGELSEDEEIICENFDKLKKVIDTTPEGSITKIRLLGQEYNFTDQIQITNKSIIIHGGNLDTPNSKPFTVLNADELCRHFLIDPDASLTINNCILTNGNVFGEKGRFVLHQRGGSIYIHGKYLLDFDHYVIHGGFLKCDNCWFVDNKAMLGGAIYNTMGKCEVTNSYFENNIAIQEDRSDVTNEYYYDINNWGGAIFTETSQGLFYNDNTDRLHIAPSRYIYNNNTQKTTIQLYFYKRQNTLLLEKENITVNNLKLYDYTAKEWVTLNSLIILPQTENETISQMYSITINGSLSENHRYYFKFVGNSSHPSIISHLILAKEGVLS